MHNERWFFVLISKLGLDADDLNHLGLMEFYKAHETLTDKHSDQAQELSTSSIQREFDLNFDSNENLKQQHRLVNLENRSEALIKAFSKIIEANNAALVSQLTELGVLPRP
jgi:hypothetical protein